MNLRKSITLFLSVATALLLSACFQHETTIRLNKDGSGTLIEESRMNTQMLAMMAGFAGGFGAEEAEAPDPLKDMLSEDKARERAAELGEGVTFEKIEPVTVGGTKGARVTFRFADINKLKISTDDSMRQMAGPGADAEPAAKSDPIRFEYKDGTLTIRQPSHGEEAEKAKDGAAEASPDQDAENPEMMAMMKQMFADMKVSVKLVAEPGIAETNASHRDGNTITLMEMDMGKLLENPDNLKKLSSVDQENPAAAMEAFKDIEGVKAELKPEVTVKLN